MKFKHILMVMTIMAIPAMGLAVVSTKDTGNSGKGSSTTVWQKEVQDPATGGVQLVGASVGTVQEGYQDTLPGSGTNTSARETASKSVKTITGQMDDIKKSQKEWEEEKAKAKKDLAEYQQKLDDLKKKKEEAIKEFDKAKAEKEALEKKVKECERNTFEYCGGKRDALEKAQKNYDQKYTEMIKANDAHRDALTADDAKKRALEMDVKQEFHDEDIQDANEALSKKISDMPDDQKQLIQSEIGLGNTDDWDSKMEDRYERKRLQDRFDQMEMLYGTDHVDLSKPEGQERAKQILDALNQKSATTDTTPGGLGKKEKTE